MHVGRKNKKEIIRNVALLLETINYKAYSLNKGDNLTITFTFKANPVPQDIKWVVTIPETVNSGNDTNNDTVVEMTPGHEDDKYMISNLTSDVDLQYVATMTIFDLEDQVRIIKSDARYFVVNNFCPLPNNAQ